MVLTVDAADAGNARKVQLLKRLAARLIVLLDSKLKNLNLVVFQGEGVDEAVQRGGGVNLLAKKVRCAEDGVDAELLQQGHVLGVDDCGNAALHTEQLLGRLAGNVVLDVVLGQRDEQVGTLCARRKEVVLPNRASVDDGYVVALRKVVTGLFVSVDDDEVVAPAVEQVDEVVGLMEAISNDDLHLLLPAFATAL